MASKDKDPKHDPSQSHQPQDGRQPALRQCPPAQLDWSRAGTPAARDFDDIYFSTDGGLAECETVFIKGCHLEQTWPEIWAKNEVFSIGELGFGSGLNFLTSWRYWQERKPKSSQARLHFLSVEKFPFDTDQLTRALSAWPELEPLAIQLLAQWPGRVRGFHRLHFGDVSLTLVHADIASALAEIDARIDAWFLDGFSPDKNPQMWSQAVMKALAHLSAPHARLASFSVAGRVRQALTNAGFEVSKHPGFGRKRHRLEARFIGTNPSHTQPDPARNTQSERPNTHDVQPLIIGAGVAGASLARAFARRGITAQVWSDPTHKAASHNPAAIIKPRLDLQDRPESRFFLASYLYARHRAAPFQIYEGLRQLAKNPDMATRHQRLVTAGSIGRAHLDIDPLSHDLLFNKALVIKPRSWLKEMLTSATQTQKVFRLGDTHIELPTRPVFLAAGYGIDALLNELPSPERTPDETPALMRLRYTRGQLSWAAAQATMTRPLSYGGYAIPMDEGLLLGATHEPLAPNDPQPFKLSAANDTRNFDEFYQATTLKPTPLERASRVSIRVNKADTLPLIGEVEPGLWLLSALGSRGFVFAPLLAEAIVCKFLGEPSPIARSVWKKFSISP